jgi:chromosome segregation ATPase
MDKISELNRIKFARDINIITQLESQIKELNSKFEEEEKNVSETINKFKKEKGNKKSEIKKINKIISKIESKLDAFIKQKEDVEEKIKKNLSINNFLSIRLDAYNTKIIELNLKITKNEELLKSLTDDLSIIDKNYNKFLYEVDNPQDKLEAEINEKELELEKKKLI